MLATRLFWLKGYGGTSIADLTAAIGIEAPSLYAAFGSKQALYKAALQHYGKTYEGFVWDKFRAAASGREAAMAYLMDSAGALTGSFADVPRGCMVMLSSLDGAAHPELGGLLRKARAGQFDRLKVRFEQAISQEELGDAVDVTRLALFIQSVQSGMSILARDGATRGDLEAVAKIAILGWDAIVKQAPSAASSSLAVDV